MIARLVPWTLCVGVLALTGSLFGQQPPANGGDSAAANRPQPAFGPFGGPGGGRLDEVKRQLGASDEEWKVIGPKLQKVIAARQAAEVRAESGFGGFGGFGGPGAPGVAFFGPGGGPGPGGPGGRPGVAFQGPGGFPPVMGFGGPPTGQIMPAFMQEMLHLTDEQKNQLAELQKEVDSKLEKLLTDEQRKQLERMRQPFRGPFGPGGPGFGPPGGGPGGAGPGGVGPGVGPAAGGEVRPVAPKDPPPAGADRGPGPKPAAVQPPAAEARPAPRVDVFIAGPGAPGMGPVGQAQADLTTVLADPKHTPDQVQEKIAAIRKARQKAREELEAAVKELRQLLTAEQEAVLVSLGYLE